MRKALVAFCFLLAGWSSADAASFLVTNAADSGAGSLRQAIVDSEASAGADEITFPGVTGTITLQSILPAISGEVTIVGPGSTALKVSGNNLTQLFSIGSGALVHISRLTIADGRAEAYLNGGAVNNAGTLTIGDCVLTNNHAHGGFGGAIYNEGELTISNSTFTGNHVTGGSSVGSGPGGALGGGGGGFGGAIYLRQGTLTLNDSTFDGNFAAGGAGDTPFSAGGYWLHVGGRCCSAVDTHPWPSR